MFCWVLTETVNIFDNLSQGALNVMILKNANKKQEPELHRDLPPEKEVAPCPDSSPRLVWYQLNIESNYTNNIIDDNTPYLQQH